MGRLKKRKKKKVNQADEFVVSERDLVKEQSVWGSGLFLGMKLIKENHNQLWLWKTLESV